MALTAAAGVFGCGGDKDTDGRGSHGRGSERTETRGASTEARDLARALGQKIVARYAGPSPTASILRAARAGRIGGVILFADNIPSEGVARSAITRLQRAARAGGNPPLLVMVDQEGGSVKRLPAAPPARAAASMGEAAEAEGRETARALRRVGFNVDLAPVADVASASGSQSWLGTRTFGATPAEAARAACDFAAGLASGGVAATLKHFPGLGRSTANTDFRTTTVRGTKEELDRDLEPYRRCVKDVELVMVASAAYSALPGGAPAVLTPAIYREWLPSVGFRGVTISDDLETPAIATRTRPARRAVNAGLDLLLYARAEATAATAYRRLLTDLRAGRIDPDELLESADRIRALKSRIAK